MFPIPQLSRTTSEEVTSHGTILFHVLLYQREVKWTPPRIWFTVNNDEIGSCVLWQSSSSRSAQSARHCRFAAFATVTAASVASSPWLGSFKSFKGSVIQSAEPDKNGVDNTRCGSSRRRGIQKGGRLEARPLAGRRFRCCRAHKTGQCRQLNAGGDAIIHPIYRNACQVVQSQARRRSVEVAAGRGATCENACSSAVHTLAAGSRPLRQ